MQRIYIIPPFVAGNTCEDMDVICRVILPTSTLVVSGNKRAE
jgi:hypothetical protein